MRRRIAVTSDEVGKESTGAARPEKKSFLEWTYAFLILIWGDPKSRMPMFLIALGASGVLQQWWLPLVYAIVVQRTTVERRTTQCRRVNCILGRPSILHYWTLHLDCTQLGSVLSLAVRNWTSLAAWPASHQETLSHALEPVSLY